MSGYYYSREAGAEGQILTGEGSAPGVGLDTLLDRERPPLRAALAIGSALADVLCIAVEDRLIHGDIRPAHVKIDSRGTVSIEGYGVARRTTKAPEGRPDTHAVDVYGLGVVLHSILSPEPLGTLSKDPDAHDDEVVSRVLSMDFRQVQGKRWLEDVRKFLCQILAYAPTDRPEALDAANVLASVAGQCPGELLEDWAARATAAPPSRAPAPPPSRIAVEEEDLGGPVALSGPLAKGGVRKAPAAKGESTAFWSREKIAAMLAEDDDDAPLPPRRQTVTPPAPVRTPEPPPRAVPSAAPPRVPEPPPPRAEAPRHAAHERPPAPRSEARPPEPRPAPVASAPVSSPFAGAQIQASNTFDDEPPPKKGMSPLMIGGIVAVLLALACGVLTLGGGGVYWFMGAGTSTAALEAAEKATEDTKAAADKATKDAEAGAAAGEAGGEVAGGGGAPGGDAPGGGVSAPTPTAPAPRDPPTTKASSTSGASKGTSTKTTATAPAKAPATKAPATRAPATKASAAPSGASAAPAGASFSVKFSAPGREGRLQCGDGQTADFAGATTMSFETTTTCLVRIDKGKGTVTVSKSAMVSCTEDAGLVACSGG